MKKIFLLLILAISWCQMDAQDQSLKDKVVALEEQAAIFKQTLGHLQEQIDEVIHQNLSLKQALHRQPVISEISTPNGLNLRLVSAKGNKQTGEITFVFSVVNNTKRDISYQASDINFVDENGYAINVDRINNAKIANRILAGQNVLYPDTPVEMNITVLHNSEPNYAKLLDIVTIDKTDNTRFINIPIKWE